MLVNVDGIGKECRRVTIKTLTYALSKRISIIKESKEVVGIASSTCSTLEEGIWEEVNEGVERKEVEGVG